jgi:hypothetical protein
VRAADNRHFARLNDAHLSVIAQSLRSQVHGSERPASAVAIADALDSVVRKRCDEREARRRANPARMGLVALRKVTDWASVRTLPTRDRTTAERPVP